MRRLLAVSIITALVTGSRFMLYEKLCATLELCSGGSSCAALFPRLWARGPDQWLREPPVRLSGCPERRVPFRYPKEVT